MARLRHGRVTDAAAAGPGRSGRGFDHREGRVEAHDTVTGAGKCAPDPAFAAAHSGDLAQRIHASARACQASRKSTWSVSLSGRGRATRGLGSALMREPAWKVVQVRTIT